MAKKLINMQHVIENSTSVSCNDPTMKSTSKTFIDFRHLGHLEILD